MSIYNRRLPRATPKRRTKKRTTSHSRKTPKKIRKKRVLPAKKKRIKKVAKPIKRRAKAIKVKAKPKVKVKAKPKPKPKPKAKPRKKLTPLQRRRREEVLADRRPRVKPKAKPRKKLTPLQRRRREEARLAREVAALREEQKRARKNARLRAKAKKLRKKISKKRIEKALVLDDLPRKTPKQKRKSQDSEEVRRGKRFRKMLRSAKTQGKLPRLGRPPNKIQSRINTGEQRLVRINRAVNDDTLEDILEAVDAAAQRMTGIYDIWLAKLIMSGFGEQLVGSNPELFDDEEDDPDARFLQTEAYESTGGYNDYLSMFRKLREILESYVRLPRTIVYLHGVNVMNFTQIK